MRIATMMPTIAQNSVVFSESFVSSNVRPDTFSGVLLRARSVVSTVAIVVPPSLRVVWVKGWIRAEREGAPPNLHCHVERPFCPVAEKPKHLCPLFLAPGLFARSHPLGRRSSGEGGTSRDV